MGCAWFGFCHTNSNVIPLLPPIWYQYTACMTSFIQSSLMVLDWLWLMSPKGSLIYIMLGHPTRLLNRSSFALIKYLSLVKFKWRNTICLYVLTHLRVTKSLPLFPSISHHISDVFHGKSMLLCYSPLRISLPSSLKPRSSIQRLPI